MHEKCKSCGTIFEVNESILTNNVKWLKCGICNEKWSLSSIVRENLIENKNKTEKVKQELASIKSIVEDKSKTLAKKPNPVLNQKNKTVAEIASELSLSKLNQNNKNTKKENDKKKNNNLNILPFLVIAFCFICFLAIFFRSTIISYSYVFFPNHTQTYIEKVNTLFAKIDLPILVNTKNLNLTNFIAKVQEQEIRFTGMIKNMSHRPILVPRIKILGVREDRKIIFEKILILEDKVIYQNSKISFNKLVRVNIQNQKDNVTIKATLLKKVFEY